jgi:pimeloyl-ACP methyl ester carboxylesterase
MAGEHDLIRRDHTDALARLIPGAREFIVPGADHTAPIRDPASVNAQIRSFLAAP